MAECEVTELIITTYCMNDHEMNRISHGDLFDLGRTYNIIVEEKTKILKLSEYLLESKTLLQMKWKKEIKTAFDYNDYRFSDEFFAMTVSGAGFENIPFSIYELYVLRFNLIIKMKDLQIRREFMEHNIEVLGEVFLM